jgi:hypothetical protein
MNNNNKVLISINYHLNPLNILDRSVVIGLYLPVKIDEVSLEPQYIDPKSSILNQELTEFWGQLESTESHRFASITITDNTGDWAILETKALAVQEEIEKILDTVTTNYNNYQDAVNSMPRSLVMEYLDSCFTESKSVLIEQI